jgi:hypothetical protein
MPSFGTRVAYAFRCFFALLLRGELPADVLAALAPVRVAGPAGRPGGQATTATVPADDRGDRAVQLLALLQRDGRLVDFLREDLAPYNDAQVGAAVRDVHARCRQVLDRYLPVEPILADAEGEPTVVGGPVDPAAVKLVGQIGSQASHRGIVRHRGWRVGRVDLPPLAAGDSRHVVAPAEVEVG